ncbi:hypothetical protein AB0G05_35760 [Nonomuraea wenchangensis]
MMTTSGPDDFSDAEVLGEEPPRRRYPRSLVLAGVAALVMVAGAGVATAAALSPSPTATAGDGASPAPSGTPSKDQGWGRGHRAGLGGPALHGEYVVRGEDGGYVTIATQYGDVTAADQDSVTVKSEDGYTKEYALTSGTRIDRGGDGTVETGQKVMVAAKVDAGTATAVVVRDVTGREQGKGWGRGWGGKGYGGGGDGGAGHGRWHHEPPASSPAPSPSESPTVS